MKLQWYQLIPLLASKSADSQRKVEGNTGAVSSLEKPGHKCLRRGFTPPIRFYFWYLHTSDAPYHICGTSGNLAMWIAIVEGNFMCSLWSAFGSSAAVQGFRSGGIGAHFLWCNTSPPLNVPWPPAGRSGLWAKAGRCLLA
jgi:hypothetical protein